MNRESFGTILKNPKKKLISMKTSNEDINKPFAAGNKSVAEGSNMSIVCLTEKGVAPYSFLSGAALNVKNHILIRL